MGESPYLQALRESGEGLPRQFPPWRIWEAGAVVALFAATQPLASLLAAMALGPVVASGLHGVAAENALFPYVLPIVIVGSHAIGWLALYLVIVRRHGMAFLQGLRLRRIDLPLRTRRRMGRILLGGMAMQFLSVIAAGLFPPPHELESPLVRFVVTGGTTALLALFVMAVIMAPLLEESMFRGLLLPALRRRLPFVPSALVVTIVFTLLHGMQTSGYWPALLAIFVAGYLMAVLRERTGSLWPSILFHFGFNLMAILPMVFLRGQLPQGWPGMW